MNTGGTSGAAAPATLPSVPTGQARRAGPLRHGARLLVRAWLLVSSRWKTRRCTGVGRRVKVEGRLVVNNFGAIHLGDGVRIRATHVAVELGSMPGGTLSIGDGTFINGGTSICAQESVRIGANCAIANYVLIMDTDFHSAEDHTLPGESRPVVIEDGAWVAARATILKGVRIGRGAVVAAGAVVTRDVPPRTLVAGVPARVVRELPALPGDGGAA